MKLIYLTSSDTFNLKPKIKEFQYGGSLIKGLFFLNFVFGVATTTQIAKEHICVPIKGYKF